MEFSQLGHHCDYPSCHQRDYLPFTCNACNKTFCLNHRTVASHECPSLETQKAKQREQDRLIEAGILPIHAAAAASSSSSSSTTTTTASSASSSSSSFSHYRCSHVGCRHKELFPNTCRNCGANFCLSHRFPTQHACTAKVGKNVIRPVGALIPASSTLLQSPQDCAKEATEEKNALQGQTPASVRRNTNTNLNNLSSLLRRPQKAH